MRIRRNAQRIAIVINAGQTNSPPIDIGEGAFGIFVVPPGSDLIGKTLQIVATDDPLVQGSTVVMPDTPLLSTPKTVAAAGAVALTSTDISECGGAKWVRFRVNAAVAVDTLFFLLWKS